MLRSVILSIPKPLSQLVSDDAPSLGGWYGDPMDAGVADRWVRRLQSGDAQHLQQVRFGDRLAELVARYWSGRDADMSYRSLVAAAGNDFERALLELCYGQLLFACKRQGARKHLDDGFALAAHLLAADEYFRVMKRHQALAVLPLPGVVAEPCSLENLLSEAGVIGKLRGRDLPGDAQNGRRHSDTLD